MGFQDLVIAADAQVLDSCGKTEVTYTPGDGGAPVIVEGIFDEAYVLMEENEFGIEQIMPMVWLRLDDLPTDPDEDRPTLTINGVDYIPIARPRDSISQTVRLQLHRKDGP